MKYPISSQLSIPFMLYYVFCFCYSLFVPQTIINIRSDEPNESLYKIYCAASGAWNRCGNSSMRSKQLSMLFPVIKRFIQYFSHMYCAGYWYLLKEIFSANKFFFFINVCLSGSRKRNFFTGSFFVFFFLISFVAANPLYYTPIALCFFYIILAVYLFFFSNIFLSVFFVFSFFVSLLFLNWLPQPETGTSPVFFYFT